MGFLDLFKIKDDINQGVEEFKTVKGAILIDVRTPSEYKEGHIPNSKNIPLQFIENITATIKDKNTPLFVYCRSGGRSSQAIKKLEKIGYTNIKNIGGISNYNGKVEK